MTTMKSIILAAALGLSSMTFASAATYNVVLNSTTKAGATKLAAGTYKLNVEGRIATFVNVETNKTVMVLVRRLSSNSTFERTAVELKAVEDGQLLESIELENSNSVLEF